MKPRRLRRPVKRVLERERLQGRRVVAHLLELGREPLDLAAQLAELGADVVLRRGEGGRALHANPIGGRETPMIHLLACG
jgi:hypothetical protein